jgi:FkbM family methyltransferase
MNLKRWLKNVYYGNFPERKRAFPYFGTLVYFPKNSLVFRVACESGIYEWENLRVLQALAEEESTVFDVGANIGLMAVPLLASSKRLRVQSFEPSPNSLPYLQRTAEGSAFGSRWQIIGKAVGSTVGSVEFNIASKELGAFDGVRNTGRVANGGTLQVPMTTIDRAWEDAGKPRVSVIKIDVEGAERMAIEGASVCIADNRPSMLVEWNSSNLLAFDCDPNWILSFAKGSGYAVHGVPGIAQVTGPVALKAQMALTESFVLLPM